MIKEIIIPASVRKSIRKFPRKIREKLYRSIDKLLEDPSYPALRHKKISGTKSYWEFSITMNYRGVYRQEKDKGFMVAVGKHEDVF